MSNSNNYENLLNELMRSSRISDAKLSRLRYEVEHIPSFDTNPTMLYHGPNAIDAASVLDYLEKIKQDQKNWQERMRKFLNITDESVIEGFDEYNNELPYKSLTETY